MAWRRFAPKLFIVDALTTCPERFHLLDDLIAIAVVHPLRVMSCWHSAVRYVELFAPHGISSVSPHGELQADLTRIKCDYYGR